MNIKRILAFTMAATMVAGSAMTAFASEPTPATADVTTAVGLSGTGSSAYVDKNVMSVVVPTANFNYKVDPEGVVAIAKNYEGTAVTKVEDKTGVLFLNTAANGAKTVSNKSDAFTITNKSAIPVQLGVTYYVEDGANDHQVAVASALGTSADFTASGNTGKAIYLGLIADGVDTEKAFTATNTTAAQYTLLSGEAGYKYAYDSTASAYTFTIDSAYTKFPTTTFYITGAINKDLAMSTWYYTADGVRKAKAVPKINFKYTLTGVRDAIALTAGFFGSDDLYVGKTSDGFATGGGFADDPDSFKINGRTVAVSGLASSLGSDFTTKVYKVDFATIAPLFGYSSAEISAMDATAKAKVKAMVKSVELTETSGGATYYGEVTQ
jgi:hypothetical protein